MTSPEFDRQRRRDIEDNIAKSQKLLKEFEAALEYETDPRTKGKYKEDIKRQKDAIAQYQEELKTLGFHQESSKLNFIKDKDFENQYFQNIIEAYSDYETYGLKTNVPRLLELEKVFIPLKLVQESVDNVSSKIIGFTGKDKQFTIWDILNKHLAQNRVCRLAIIGPPGSGKTTLVQHLRLTYANAELFKKYLSSQRLFPIILYLKEEKVGESIANHSIDLLELIEKQELIQKLDVPRDWIESKLNTKDCLILLDGLDEIGSKTKREKVSKWLEKQIEKYSNIHFIITSRPFGYRNNPVKNIRFTLEVQPFNLKQMHSFLENWYLQNEILANNFEDNYKIRETAKNKSQDLINRIKKSSALAEMALNPLLLTMIATVHCFRGFLPKRRVELFAEICDVLLGRRQDEKGITQNFTPDQKKAILQVLALKLMQKRERQFELEEADLLIKDELDKLTDSQIKSKNFIEDIETLSGLLVEKEKGIYEFAHFNFQEYLAAAQIKDYSLEFFPKFIFYKRLFLLRISLILYWTIVKTLKRNTVLTKEIIDDPWWYETICLYAAISDATYLIQAALIKSDLVSLNLALDCVEQGLKVSPEVREEVIAKLEQGLESSDKEIFKLAVEVKLARRFKKLLRLDDNFKIDTNYITAAEYKFYLNESSDRDTSHLINFKHKKAKQPIKGVTWEDSLGFCAWLTSKASSFQFDKTEETSIDYYRLPTTKENNDNPILGNEGLKSWTIKNENNSQEKSIRIVKVSIDSKYSNLINLLAAEEWQKADSETTNLIKKEVGCEDSDNLDIDNIQEIPSKMLCTIDRLWMIYSGGSYGLGVQTKIWETNGNNSFMGCLPSSWSINNLEYKEFLQHLNQKFNDSQIERCEIKNSLLSQIITTYPLEFQTVQLNEKGQESQ
ncbi:MAG: GUN4 domain-containing protein, partial [Prochloraceae cyanobacterium]